MSKLESLLNRPRPLVMGILNTTPDSFSDGGRYIHQEDAEKRIKEMLSAGADIIDIGGESTRPGAAEVSLEDELKRVIPLIKVAKALGAIVSVDTSKAEVMSRALEHNVDLINDVRALQEKGALEAVTGSGAYLCLMHMKGQPRTMQQNPQYDDVVAEVQDMLRKRIAECEKHGIDRKKIIVDPGFGFGKSLKHNTELMGRLELLQGLGCPVLVGVSRKTMIGQILDQEIPERLVGSVVAATYAALKGAKILRVHDVKETVQAMKVISAFKN
ncbi:dihydropteroate synthase [Kangiella geojedonensis]|uniref:Dihydropteroate synthase n=1 Tax=Kangiella geojedonensis TaxID=914150 RepID=A0A0F6RBJ7_9GAMM|nr:dihydropteroate synthase [Kangiella geojedonensis]AKE51206.1 dihydropteroate synthase [Kangiella geojedonensis]